MAEFAGAFGDADTVQVLDIYAASEEPIAGVTAEALVAAMAKAGGARWLMRGRWVLRWRLW